MSDVDRMRRSRQRHKGRTTKGLVQRRLLGVRPKSLPTRLLGWRLRAKTNYVGLVMGLAAEKIIELRREIDRDS